VPYFAMSNSTLSLFFLLTLFFNASCGSQRLSMSSQLSPGMSKPSVKSIMGDPIKTEFSGNVSAWHWCSTGISDRFVTAIFVHDKLVDVHNYTVTAAQAGAYGNCANFTRAVNFASYQNHSTHSAPSTSQPTKKSTQTSGTAWLLDSGYVVTNYHVIENASSVSIRTTDNVAIVLKLITKDKANDIAILHSQSLANRRGFKLHTDQMNIGASVVTMGFPHSEIMGSNIKLSTGIINSLTGFQDDPRTFQISVPIQPGNSGGPLINDYGNVIGIVTSKLNAMSVFMWTGDIPENVSYAVKTQYLDILLRPYLNHTHNKAQLKQKMTIEEIASYSKDKIFQIIAVH
jgi:S1-C subfamily serine protease